MFRILNEGSVATGVRRMETQPGAALSNWSRNASPRANEVASLLHVKPDSVTNAVKQLRIKTRRCRRKRPRYASRRRSRILNHC